MAHTLQLAPGAPPEIARGRYRIAGLAGSGVTSDVYLAYDTEQAVWRALKVLRFEHLRSDRVRARFAKAAQVMRDVEHPHLLRAFDARADDLHTPWILTELCEGGSLQDWLSQNGRMPAYLAIEALVQITGAMAWAHRAGITLRNLRASRVLVDRNGALKLTAYYRVGVVKSLPHDSSDVRTDVRDAAALLYQLLTGRVWDDARGTDQLFDVEPALAAIIAKATDTRRGRSYAGAEALGRALEAGMLEIDIPMGDIPPLAPPDCALPNGFDAVYQAGTPFPLLAKAVAWRDDPANAEAPPEQGNAADFIQSLATRKGGTPVSPAPRNTPIANPYVMPVARQPAQTRAEVEQATPNPAQPSYVVSEPAREQRWGANATELTLEQPPGGAPAKAREAPGMTREARAAIALVGVGLFGLLAWAFLSSAAGVNAAANRAGEAGNLLVAQIERNGSVVYDLAARGADRTALEQGFYAVTEARGEKRIDAAIAFARSIEREAARAGIDPDRPNAVRDDATVAVDTILDAHADLEARTLEWSQQASSVGGTVVVAIGLASEPRPERVP